MLHVRQTKIGCKIVSLFIPAIRCYAQKNIAANVAIQLFTTWSLAISIQQSVNVLEHF